MFCMPNPRRHGWQACMVWTGAPTRYLKSTLRRRRPSVANTGTILNFVLSYGFKLTSPSCKRDFGHMVVVPCLRLVTACSGVRVGHWSLSTLLMDPRMKTSRRQPCRSRMLLRTLTCSP
ncbi:hypothetical protein BD310DRAFT_959381 [Dichomitus squalens]|uniref:Uncharacterized protein n=1 Tax=Dichomitus squalens TaxID=114155 RepID=A0A4Q9PTH6_9APHY|nr:hypothetical protein BD310DRAFT_959381 [Dichomitus squalens]